MVAPLLASAGTDGIVALIAQLGSLIFTGAVGRWLLTSRLLILIASLLGGLGAMVSSILIDGQGAFLYLFATPLIYFAAVTGRSDLDPA